MPSKSETISKTKAKNAAIAARTAALPKIPKEAVDRLVPGPMSPSGMCMNVAPRAREPVCGGSSSGRCDTTHYQQSLSIVGVRSAVGRVPLASSREDDRHRALAECSPHG